MMQVYVAQQMAFHRLVTFSTLLLLYPSSANLMSPSRPQLHLRDDEEKKVMENCESEISPEKLCNKHRHPLTVDVLGCWLGLEVNRKQLGNVVLA